MPMYVSDSAGLKCNFCLRCYFFPHSFIYFFIFFYASFELFKCFIGTLYNISILQTKLAVFVCFFQVENSSLFILSKCKKTI